VKDLYVVIVGCGRLGSQLANALSRLGMGVVAIDSSDSAFSGLSRAYSGFRVEGDATEPAVLRAAKMDKADLVIATTRDDNVNLMVAQTARTLFSVPRVMARVFDPKRERMYRALGIEPVCPTVLAVEAFMNIIRNQEDKADAS